MAISNASRKFESPKFRQLLAIISSMWLGLVILLTFAMTLEGIPLDFTDPLLTPFVYLTLFGISSAWVVWRYRQRRISMQAIWGVWPTPQRWLPLIGLWIVLFMFSLGAFQVSFGLLSYLLPEFVEGALKNSIFLGSSDTTIPWLYNLLMFGILVLAAPVFEEFIFRGFLLHRWGTRWNLKIAVILSSLFFGILHSNVIGLTVFGATMALLYLRSGSLGLAIFIHSLNNAVVASLEIFTRLTNTAETPSLEEFRASIWLGIILMTVSTPLLVRFFKNNWFVVQGALPYFANRDRLTQA